MEIINYLNNIFIEVRRFINDIFFDIKEKNYINFVLSKLKYSKSNYYKIFKENNKIYIKYHSYYINIFKNTIDNDYNKEEIKLKSIEYKQSLIFTKNINIPICKNYYQIINNDNNKELFICIKYYEIIIDLEKNNYSIIKSFFNIRKPSYDKFNLFERIINNIDNPSYYFICNYDLNSLNENYSDIKNNIYDMNNIRISFNNNNDNSLKINFDLIMPTSFTLSTDIDTKPLISNQIKRIVINGGFI